MTDSEPRETESEELAQVVDLLGGYRVFRHRLRNPIDVHEALVQGIPGAALVHLIDNLVAIDDPASIEKATGMSLRTLQRHKVAPAKRLSRQQSGRAWKFAEILAKATSVLGSKQEAEQWLERPAIGLDQRRPIDLLATSAGVEIVEEHLERLEHGVYA
ncbi:MAG: type II RES/Xre toxin-antitoxin system antitoxin [Dongiaceae bacterium]